jgi:hypothetical protein
VTADVTVSRALLRGAGLASTTGHSFTYRIAVGPRTGQKLFTLQTVPAALPQEEGSPNGAACAGAFSLHARVNIAASRWT